mmetsp:Transcript_12835/g.19334  ORF Transcript_12835/g.19334 Transcript_12835/m.19334 type:complete len:174 (+) Transcript_12835:34-555(+)
MVLNDIRVDTVNHRYPFALVWTPIPLLSWVAPPIGHIGICDSKGYIHDFSGPYSITVDSMLFGNPTRYLQPDGCENWSSEKVNEWDAALANQTCSFRKQMYNFFTNNCHRFVSAHMNDVAFNNQTNWNEVRSALTMFFKGRYVSPGRLLLTWVPFLAIVGFICVLLGFSALGL